MKIKIYGCSDDLVEVEGDFSNEYGSFDKPLYMMLSCGAVIKAMYGKEINGEHSGIWSVEIDQMGDLDMGKDRIEIKECFDEEADPYSDVIEISSMDCDLSVIMVSHSPMAPVTKWMRIANKMLPSVMEASSQSDDNWNDMYEDDRCKCIAKLANLLRDNFSKELCK